MDIPPPIPPPDAQPPKIPSPAIGQILFSFRGRIRRRNFWTVYLGLLAVNVAVTAFILLGTVGGANPALRLSLGVLFGAISIWIWLAICTKRWHDANLSGWLTLTLLIPLIGIAVPFVLGVLPGTKGMNKYGPDPKSGPTHPRLELIGLVCACIFFFITVSIGLASLVVPQMSKTRVLSQEVAAQSEIRTINVAEVQYQAEFGQYATSLAQLGPPAQVGTAEGPQAAGLITSNLASGSTAGYNFTLTQAPNGYSLTAVPKTFGSTGRRTFYSDQSAIIRENWGQEPATAQSPEIK